ncbi:endolytic transglycosylase MltG [Streptomyces sp. NPDC049954]|uniref:endolytic transglycosylase MltG n=1 Tax=Streptomyces sp. NPDC049954 TaxID=3155779 RepID=UPI003423168A
MTRHPDPRGGAQGDGGRDGRDKGAATGAPRPVRRPPGRAPRTRGERPRHRLTRRGRLSLLIAGVLAVAATVTVPLLLSGEENPGPRSLTVPEGWRARQVYAAVDCALRLSKGATEASVASAGLPLPAEAKGNPEGYLYPATYPLTGDSTPASVLRYMVRTAKERFAGRRPAAVADREAVSPYETVKVASIVQAEAATDSDMGRVARVVYNRLHRGMPLQMDSTLNYALGRSSLDTTGEDTRVDSPYNTYARRGLPPTPIASPGEQAVRAAVAPSVGDWLYFVTVGPGDTRFTGDYAQHRKNVAEFNRRRSTATPGT